MTRMMAIVEREMRKFFRSPTLMMVSMMLPLVQLVILGNAFGGKIVGAKVGVVDYDHGSQALKVHEAFNAVAANIRTFTTTEYPDEQKAREDVRTGKLDAAVIIPAQRPDKIRGDRSHRSELPADYHAEFLRHFDCRYHRHRRRCGWTAESSAGGIYSCCVRVDAHPEFDAPAAAQRTSGRIESTQCPPAM